MFCSSMGQASIVTCVFAATRTVAISVCNGQMIDPHSMLVTTMWLHGQQPQNAAMTSRQQQHHKVRSDENQVSYKAHLPIARMRHCAENALCTYLSLRSLGAPATQS